MNGFTYLLTCRCESACVVEECQFSKLLVTHISLDNRAVGDGRLHPAP